LTFEPPDLGRFPALGLAYAAGRAGGAAPAVLGAANEVAVEAFLAGRLDFPGITACVAAVLDSFDGRPAASVAAVLEADRWARQQARSWVGERGTTL
jgi:1-deoxy-D-xylulose-5-phosphate reductoisomerase